MVEGELKFEQWQDKEGVKKSKHTIRMTNFQYMDAKPPADNSDVNREIGANQDPNSLYAGATSGASGGAASDEIPF